MDKAELIVGGISARLALDWDTLSKCNNRKLFAISRAVNQSGAISLKTGGASYRPFS